MLCSFSASDKTYSVSLPVSRESGKKMVVFWFVVCSLRRYSRTRGEFCSRGRRCTYLEMRGKVLQRCGGVCQRLPLLSPCSVCMGSFFLAVGGSLVAVWEGASCVSWIHCLYSGIIVARNKSGLDPAVRTVRGEMPDVAAR